MLARVPFAVANGNRPANCAAGEGAPPSGHLPLLDHHCSTKPLARSSGRSAVAAAAYRSGDGLVDEWQGLEHDCTRRNGVLHSQVVLPEQAGEWSRAELWNAAEKREKRKDARTAREWELALPDEGLAAKYGCAVDVALHAPESRA